MPRNSKRYLSIVIAFLLVFSNFNGIIVHAASEELNQSVSIHVDKTEAGPNEDVLVSVTAAGSQNLASIGVNYRLPDGKFTVISTRFNPATGNFEAKIPVRDYSAAGLWSVTAINLYYNEGDPAEILDYETDLSGGNFTVNNENASVQDTADPVFTSVSVDKTEAFPGDVVKVSIDATDDLSGISAVEYNYSGYSSKVGLAFFNEQTQKYEANIPIEEFERSGDRALNVVAIRDYAGNSYEVYYDDVLTSGNFQVINANEDVTAPTVNGVSVDKKEASVGDTVTWSFDISDDKSGVAYVSVTYENPADLYDRKYGNAVYNETTKMYEMKVAITEETLLGDWRIRSINVGDKANNGGDSIRNSAINGRGEYDFSPGNFKVVEKSQEEIDVEAPLLHGVTIDKSEARPGEQVTVSIDVTDNFSGVKDVTITYENETVGSWAVNAVYNQETAKYEAVFPVNQETTTGKWVVPYIIITDQNDNSQTYWYSDNQYFDNVAFTVINANDIDVTAPVVNGMTVDKKEVKVGEEVTLSLDVTDDLSGVNEVYVRYWNDYYGVLEQYASYNEETKKYEIKIPISYTTQTGKWMVDYISVSDNHGNSDSFYSNFTESEFTVLTEGMDDEVPVLNSVTVDKNEAHPGDTVTVSIDANDDKSGIDYITASFWMGNRSQSFDAVYNPETGKYEIKLQVDDSSRPGIWSINNIYVQDKAYNGEYFSSYNDFDFSNAEITVINENADITPPTIQGVFVDKTEVYPGDTVTVSIDATDDKSEINQLTVEYWGSNGGSKWMDAVYIPETNKYEAVLQIDDETRPGEWVINYIYIEDTQGNSITHYDDSIFEAGTVKVFNPNVDVTPPVISGVSVDKQEAKPGDTVTLSIDAQDDNSGIYSIDVQYYAADRYLDEQEAVFNPETGKYEVELSINDQSRPGEWSIDSIYVRDKEYNGYRYNNGGEHDFASANFTVVNENADVTPPTVTAVSVDKNEVQPGETVTVSIDAADDKSEITYMEVKYRNNYYGTQYQEAVYNSETNKFEVSIPVNTETKPGEWRLENIYLQDSEGNYDRIYSYEDIDFSTGNYTVVNDNIDITAPVVNSVSVDKTDAVFGDSVKVSLDVTDAQSGVENVNVYLIGSTGGNRYETAEFNPETNLYELNLPITETFKPGQWRISYVNVRDQEYNEEYYYNGENADFSAADFNVVNENADITPPVVHSVSVDKTEVQPGDTLTVSLDVTDDKSGPQYVDVYYYDQSGREIYQSAYYNEETQKYEAAITIDDETYPGEWQLNNIMVQDHEYNFTNYQNGEEYDFSSGHFIVINDLIDNQAPKVTSVSVDKTEANPGDTVTVSIEAVDDKSGIQTVSVQYFGGNRYIEEQDAVFNSETGKYEVEIPITDTARPGVWSISTIRVVDNNYNSDYIYNGYNQDLSGGDFTVLNENADMTPPTFTTVSVDKTNAQPGETVTISLEAADDKSGISYMELGYRNSYGGYRYLYPEFNPETNKYEVEFTVDDKTKPGTWSLGYVHLTDNEGNSDRYYEEVSSGDFTVFNENVDVTPPVLNSVSVDKAEAYPGDVVKVSLDVTDVSGVDTVYVYAYGSIGGYIGVRAEYNSETKMYEALFPINESTKPGEWGISSVEVRDIEYNYKYYSDGEDFDFTNADFTVINENADITPPTIQEVSVNKKVANNGDEVTVSLTVVDDKSGVNRVTVDFRNNAGRSQLGEGIYNESTQKYDVKFKVSDNTRPGNWFVNSIYVVDGEWNSKDYRNGMDGNDFSAAEFTVINENADVTPPTLLGVSVDKNSLQVGEEVTISLDVKDEQSDIGYINVNYKLPNRSYKNAQAYFNSLTGKYEAKIEIGQYAKSGTWVIEDVNVQDTEGNSKYIFNNKASSGYQGIEGMDLSSGNFVVKNDNEDSTPPEVRSMTVNKTQFVPGETAIVELDVFDHQSGVNDVYIAFSGSNNGYVHTSAYYNETTHKYEAQIQVDDSTRPGLWSLEYIYVNDNEGNYQNLDSDEYDFSSANYSIINEAVDIIPPSVNSISVDKQEVKAGEEITISLDVKDDQSTVEEVSAVLTSNNDNDPWGFAGHVNESAIYNEGTHKFELKLQIPEDMKPGSWGIQYLTVSDSEGNTAEMYQEEHADLLSGSTFTVINDQADVAVPTFSGITADKKVVNVGEEITFSVDATDESGIQDVFVVLDGTMDTYSGAIYNEKTNKYDIAIPITEYYKPGTWKVQLVTIYDKENNGIVLNSDDVDFSELDFEIINDKFVDYMDNPADYINSISVDKNAAVPGDIVTLNINFKDSYNLRNVDVWYAGGTNNNFNREAFYNEKTGNYEVKIPITSLYKPAFWSLRGIYAQKIDGTLLNLFTNEIVDFTKGDFSVTNSKLDSVAPVAPEVDEVTDQSSTVTGTTEANVKVIVKSGEQELGTAISDWEGKFSIEIDVLSAGTELSVVAMDSSENTSSATTVTVVDTTPPAQPEVNDVFDNAETVSGKGEAGATVKVTIGENDYIGTVDKAGTFTVKIPFQKAGTSISVTLEDAAENSSEAVTTTVVDKTPPTAPTVGKVTDRDTVVSGTTEANATVTVMAGETKIGNGNADETGKFSITITKQKAETQITVIAKDKAENSSTTEIKVEAGYSPVKIELNGKDFARGGYYRINTTYVNWNALETFKIPYTHNENGEFQIEGRTVQGVEINGDWYIEWKQLSPGNITFKKIEDGYNFIYTKPVKIQLNGKDFALGGYYRINTTYVNWNALKTLNIPYSDKGNGLFEIEGRSVQAEAINGDWYIEWKQLSYGNITFKQIEGGYNFIYTKPVKIQLNGKDFALGGYYRINTTYVNWNALKTLDIPYTYKGNGEFLIEGRTVKGESINGDWYIEWKQLSFGNVTFKQIEGGYNFIYTKPVKIQLNGKDFGLGGYYKINTTYVNWNALKTLSIPYTYKGNGVFLIEGRTVKGESINGDWYIEWKQLSYGNITFKQIEGGYNFIYTKPVKIQLNGKDFGLGGYYRINTTYVNWNALKTLKIPYSYKGNGVFLIEGRTVKGVSIKGDWYIEWKQLSPGKITFKVIEGGYNFIYKP